MSESQPPSNPEADSSAKGQAKADVTLTRHEKALLKLILSRMVIRRRTGELGIKHGMGRFVATDLVLSEPARKVLLSLLAKFQIESIEAV